MVVGVNKCAEWPGISSDLSQQAVIIRCPVPFEGAATFLNQPQPHDVLEQPIRTVDPPFIGHIQFQGALCQHRMRQFQPHQGPCSRTDVSPVSPPGIFGRNCSDGGPGIMRCRCNNAQSRQPCPTRNLFAQIPQPGAGINNVTKHLRWNIQLTQQVECPVSSRRMEHLRSRRVREFNNTAS